MANSTSKITPRDDIIRKLQIIREFKERTQTHNKVMTKWMNLYHEVEGMDVNQLSDGKKLTELLELTTSLNRNNRS